MVVKGISIPLKDERGIRRVIDNILADLAEARATGDDNTLLEALDVAIAYMPVSALCPSPVEGWLDEAEQLVAELDAQMLSGHFAMERGRLALRKRDLQASLTWLERAREAPHGLQVPSELCEAVVRAQALIRLGELKAAEGALRAAEAFSPGTLIKRLVPWPKLARAEHELALGNAAAALQILREAMPQLEPAALEDHILWGQLLSLAHFLLGDRAAVSAALGYVRCHLVGSGLLPEAALVDAADGFLMLQLGDAQSAAVRFKEGVTYASFNEQRALIEGLNAGLSLVEDLRDPPAGARRACLSAIALCAEQGSAIAVCCIVAFLNDLYLQENNAQEALRALMTGLRLATRFAQAPAELMLRAKVEHLRNERIGPATFDAMIAEMKSEEQNAANLGG